MLEHLVGHIHQSLLHYVKRVEGKRYRGNNVFSLSYVQKSAYLSEERIENIEEIVYLCKNAIKKHHTPKQLALAIHHYAKTINGILAEWFHCYCRLQNMIFQAIAHYYPEFLRWDGNAIVFNELSPAQPPLKPEIMSDKLAPQTLQQQQAEQLVELITQLKIMNQKLVERFEEQEVSLKKITEDNLQLRQRLAETNLHVLQLRQQSLQTHGEATVVTTKRFSCN